jgi:ATP synthase protein I
LLNKGQNLAQYSEYLGLGIQIAAVMILPLLLGVWLDNKFGYSPWFTAVGALVGVIGIFAMIVKIAIMANQKTEADKRKRKEKDIKK